MICTRDLALLAGLVLAAPGLAACDGSVEDPSGTGAAAPTQPAQQRADIAAMHGERALLAGDLALARAWLEPGEFSAETRAEGFRSLGRLEMAQGNLPAAGAAFDQSYRADPANAGLWVDIGRLRYAGGEQAQALEAVDRALAIDPAHAEALRFRGQLARDARGLATGAERFARALELHPQNRELRLDLAATLSDAGRAQDALAVLRGGDGTAAAAPRGLFVQAVIAARGGDVALARDLLERSGLAKDGVASAQLLSALIDLQQENYAIAAVTLDRLYSRQPDNRRIRDLLAFALSRSAGERELVRRFAGIVADDPASAYLRTLVGRAYEALGDRARAARFLDQPAIASGQLTALPSLSPVRIAPTSQATGALQLRDQVRHAIVAGDGEAAVTRAAELARRFPGSADAQAVLGDASFAVGDKPAARAAYGRAARIRLGWPLALRLARAQDDVPRAQRMLADYVRQNPMNGEAAAALADSYAAQGDWPRAVGLLDHALDLGMGRVPWVLAARSVGARQLGDADEAMSYALAAHELEPMNPLAISALLAAMPDDGSAARAELEAKLRSLQSR